MNVAYGWVVSTMHDTNIHEIGTHTPTLYVGSKRKMKFKETDEGPFWLEEEIRALSKFDIF